MSDPPADLHYDTGVLRNKLGIADRIEWTRIERIAVESRAAELASGSATLAGLFNFDRLMATHHHLFQDVYSWAGVPRNWDIAKYAPDGALTHFIAGDAVQEVADEVFQQLADADYLAGEGRRTPAKLAFLYNQLNVLHAFHEGNGRTNRLFVRALAADLGHPLQFDPNDNGELLEATITAARGVGDAPRFRLEKLFQQAAARGH